VPTTYYPRCLVVLDVLLEDYSDGAPTETHQIVCTPRQVTIHRNNHREADDATVEIDYSSLPLDPRAIRQARVGVYLADVEDPQVKLSTSDTEHLAFVGLVDELETEGSDSGRQVRIEARDYTGLLLDHTWSAGALAIDQPLQDVVDDILRATPGAGDMVQEYAQGTAETVLAGLVGRTKWTPRQGDDSWTVLVDLCGLVGLVPVVELDVLHIRTASHRSGTAATLKWGRNVSNLRMKRAYDEIRTRQIRVICWDEAARESREATYPAEPVVLRRKIGADGKVSTDNAPLLTYHVTGSHSTDRLQELAQAIYDEGARQQVEGEIETREMRDWGNLESTPRLANGDTLILRADARLRRTIASMSHGEAVEWLISGPEGLDSMAAEALVTSVERADSLASTFYITKATHRWSWDDGYEATITFANFVGPGA